MMRALEHVVRAFVTHARAGMCALCIVLAFAAPVTAQRPAGDGFPHAKHAKLFPTCNGCHAGIVTGNLAATMPPPASCAECHDGRELKRVRYDANPPKRDFLRFVHADHGTVVEKSGRECVTCHAISPESAWMQVRRATPDGCQSCHTHRSAGHLASDNRCATCHLTLARATTLTTENISAFPKPPSHAEARFSAGHAPLDDAAVAQCATCHSRESCARCHVNASAVPSIRALVPDARVATALRGRSASYFTPTDHRGDAWASVHGAAATAETQRCATCHARPSCTVCHTGVAGQRVIQALPEGRSGVPGVQLVRPRRIAVSGNVAPRSSEADLPVAIEAVTRALDSTRTIVRPHPDGFERTHATTAAAGRLTCEGCHTQRFCSDCHAGESRRNFHVANFVARHAPESYGRDIECASCHNTEVFCRACHETQGLATRGQKTGAYHNAQPLWLLQHGQAARRGLQSCTTCHTQRDCMQCHSQLGWGVNPHGPDFKPERVGKAARVTCARCHLTDPTKGR